MALQGCRSIEMYRANLGDFSSTYGQHYLKLDGKNSIRTVILRPDLASEIARYRQARAYCGEKLTPTSPLFISLSNRRYGQRLSRSGIGHVVDGYLEKCGLKHNDLNTSQERNISPHSLPSYRRYVKSSKWFFFTGGTGFSRTQRPENNCCVYSHS